MKKKILGIFVCTVLIASISNIMVVIGQTPLEHDVGVTAIEEPTSGCASDWDAAFPVEVTIKNFGTNEECCFKVKVEIGEVGAGGLPEYQEYQCIATIEPEEKIVLDFGEWTPKELADKTPFCNDYYVKAWTELEDPQDQNATNDCLTKIITINMPAVAAVEEINDYIQKLDDVDFDGDPPVPANRRNALKNMLIEDPGNGDSVVELIELGDYGDAIEKLKAIKKKMDGSSPDWIIDSDAQDELCEMIDNLIAYLEMLV